jgi:hypothetical protein
VLATLDPLPTRAVPRVRGHTATTARRTSDTQESFSWKQVGQAALGGAVTAGIGQMAQAGGMLQGLQGSGAWASAGRAALSSGVNQALHGNWSWREIVASAVGGGAGAAAGNALNDSALGNAMGSVGRGIAAGFVGGVAGQWAGPGGKANYGSVFASTLGSVTGDEIVGSMQPAPAAGSGLRVNESTASTWGPHYRFDEAPTPADYSLAGGGDVRLGAYSSTEQGVPEGWTRQTYIDGNLIRTENLGLPPLPGPGRIDPDTGVQVFAVGMPHVIEVQNLPVSAARAVAQTPDMWQQYRADTSAFYEQAHDQAVIDGNPAAYVGAKLGGLAGEVYHDMLAGARGLYGLATSAEARTQLLRQLDYAVTHPDEVMDAAVTGVRGFAAKPFDEQADAVFKEGLGLLAGAGGAKLGSAAGSLALQSTEWLAGRTMALGNTALRWTQALGDYSLEFPSLAGTGFARNQMGAIAIPTVRNLRAEVTALLPEDFSLVRLQRGGTAILRYGDDTFYSVPKGQYSLIPELRAMDTMGDAFTSRVQAIADGFDTSMISRGQRLRLDATPDGWLKDKFLSSYKGSSIHGRFSDELKYIDGSADYAYKTVGPDIVRIGGNGGGLKYEITQLTDSLNAVYSHAKKYPGELLRYVTYR